MMAAVKEEMLVVLLVAKKVGPMDLTVGTTVY